MFLLTYRWLIISFILEICTAGDVWKLHKLNITKYPNAKCIDGSPGGFYYLPGYGDGKDKFITMHQGGAWCTDYLNCYYRGFSETGSSTKWDETADCSVGNWYIPCGIYYGDGGIGSSDPLINPITYNWNKVFALYCDGGSFSGHVVEEVIVPDNNKVIHLKGRFILDALYDTLLEEFGMNKASEVVIFGSSAGALAVFLQVDHLHHKIIQSFLPNKPPRVTALTDAGFFMHYPTINGEEKSANFFQSIFRMQHMSSSINHECLRHYSQTKDAWKCIFPQYVLPFIKTNIFIANSLSDKWEGENLLGLTNCNPTIAKNCSQQVFTYLNDFRSKHLEESVLGHFLKKPNAGAWLCECWTHMILQWNHYWSEVKVQGWTLNQVFANWYRQDRSSGPWVVVDGEWGSNSC